MHELAPDIAEDPVDALGLPLRQRSMDLQALADHISKLLGRLSELLSEIKGISIFKISIRCRHSSNS